MKFKTKVAYSAVLATLGLVAGSAQAAFLADTGNGQVLIYPYYSVQGGMDTYVSVVNTTSASKAVKVRFIEGKASQEVLDFNLYLSKYDVWTAAVTSSTTGGAKLITNDTSCTAPQITGAVEFRNLKYTDVDSFENDLARTREGYLEIIEMGVPNTVSVTIDGTAGRSFDWAVTHKSGSPRVPNNCAYVNAQWAANSSAGAPGNSLAVSAPTGGLIGTGTLINVAQGVDYSYDPTAIDGFVATNTSLHTVPGNTRPSLTDADRTSIVVQKAGAVTQTIVTQNWAFGEDAISAVLMRNNVMNEYTVEAGLNAGTDWVVTFPNKNLYVFANSFFLPFTKRFGDLTVAPYYTKDATKWKACEPVTLSIYDREEDTKAAGIDFSPSTTPTPTLCFEANVITFKSTNVLGSLNLKKDITDVFTNGWMNLSLYSGTDHYLVPPVASTNTVAGTAVANTQLTYTGLPVVGFAVQKLVNGNVGGVLSNYGGAYNHKYTRNVIVN